MSPFESRDDTPWPLTESRRLADYRLFELWREARTNPRTGEPHGFFVVRTTDWVNIIALTDDDEVVLVRQLRAGTGEHTIEIPGGMVDPGEDPGTAALRELVEETGYVAETCVPIGVVHPNPALFSNRCHTFLASGARRVKEPELDPGEAILVATVPRARLRELIASGAITHALVVAAVFHLERHAEGGHLDAPPPGKG